jgi:hypothetical protein
MHPSTDARLYKSNKLDQKIKLTKNKTPAKYNTNPAAG